MSLAVGLGLGLGFAGGVIPNTQQMVGRALHLRGDTVAKTGTDITSWTDLSIAIDGTT
jgi:hypothetical protein